MQTKDETEINKSYFENIDREWKRRNKICRGVGILKKLLLSGKVEMLFRFVFVINKHVCIVKNTHIALTESDTKET